MRRRSTRSEEHTSELQSHVNLVCRLLLEKKKNNGSFVEAFDKKNRAAFVAQDLVVPAGACHGRSFSVIPLGASDLHVVFFFFNDTATTEIYTLSLHDALPILCLLRTRTRARSSLQGRLRKQA